MNEMPCVYACELRKARKEHKCCECGGAIQAGENYHYHHGIWDGSAGSYKACQDCEALRIDVDKDVEYDDEKTAFTDLIDSVFENGDRELIRRFIEIKRKRGAEVKPWMIERLEESEQEAKR